MATHGGRETWSLALACLGLLGCGRVDFDLTRDGSLGDGNTGDTESAAPPRFVQATPLSSLNSASSTTVAFTTTPQAGDMIVVFAWSWVQGVPVLGPGAVTDNHGNVYAEAVNGSTGAVNSCSVGSAVSAIYYLPAIAATTGAWSILLTPGGPAGQELDLVAVEYAGITAFDQMASHGTPAGSSPYVFDSGAITTALPNELLVSAGLTCSGNLGTVTWSDFGGFIARATQSNSSAYQPCVATDMVSATPGSYSDTWTIMYAAGNGPALGLIASFR